MATTDSQASQIGSGPIETEDISERSERVKNKIAVADSSVTSESNDVDTASKLTSSEKSNDVHADVDRPGEVDSSATQDIAGSATVLNAAADKLTSSNADVEHTEQENTEAALAASTDEVTQPTESSQLEAAEDEAPVSIPEAAPTASSSSAGTQRTVEEAVSHATLDSATLATSTASEEKLSEHMEKTQESSESEEGKATPGSTADLAPLSEQSSTVTVQTVQSSQIERSQSEQDTARSSPTDNDNGQSVYYIKWIQFRGQKVPIITQNENGPCPLLAIINVLLLKGKVKLPPMLEMISSEQLMTHLGDCVIENRPTNLTGPAEANYEQNMQDAMTVMYKLQTGLDVNVRFTGVRDFEYTPECIIFDLLGIPLYHGWLVDPQDVSTVTAVNRSSYNQLVERIITQKQSNDERLIRGALVAEQFLEGSASQLTYHGLCELGSTLQEDELSVFFRNNHFNTLLKHNSELFILVTDQGFLTESNVVWATLSSVEGDCHFVDASFRTYTKPEPPPVLVSPNPNTDLQIDQDYQVALSLQQEAAEAAEAVTQWAPNPQEQAALQLSDHELALRLQEEENRRAALLAQQNSQSSTTQAPSTSSSSSGSAQANNSNRRHNTRDRNRDRDRERERELQREQEREREREKEDKCVIL